jgi:uncharacterized LabA/DUF88 family protein
MPNAVFLIDGFNIYHALDYTPLGPDHYRYRKYKWLNFKKLAQFYLPDPSYKIADVVFFTTIVTWDPGKEERHRKLISANKKEGVRVIEGVFKDRDAKCKICKKMYRTREEKRTDVNIAVEMLRLRQLKQYDLAILLSGDSDLIPVFGAVRELYPGTKISVVIPIGKSSHDIRKAADSSFQMTEKQLSQSLFPDSLTLDDGSVVSRPNSWK